MHLAQLRQEEGRAQEPYRLRDFSDRRHRGELLGDRGIGQGAPYVGRDDHGEPGEDAEDAGLDDVEACFFFGRGGGGGGGGGGWAGVGLVWIGGEEEEEENEKRRKRLSRRPLSTFSTKKRKREKEN